MWLKLHKHFKLMLQTTFYKSWLEKKTNGLELWNQCVWGGEGWDSWRPSCTLQRPGCIFFPPKSQIYLHTQQITEKY